MRVQFGRTRFWRATSQLRGLGVSLECHFGMPLWRPGVLTDHTAWVDLSGPGVLTNHTAWMDRGFSWTIPRGRTRMFSGRPRGWTRMFPGPTASGDVRNVFRTPMGLDSRAYRTPYPTIPSMFHSRWFCAEPPSSWFFKEPARLRC